MSVPLWLALYVVLAVMTVFSTARASHYIHEIDGKTKISGALLGGVVLATVTSLPEFITTITSTVALESPGLSFGNVFGSNMFNLLILAVVDLVFVKHLFFDKTRTGIKTNALIILMYLIFIVPFASIRFTALGIDFFNITIGLMFSFVSLMIIIIYIFALRSMSQELPQEKVVSNSALSLKSASIRFTLWAVAVILSSYFITVVTDGLASELNLSASFAGAIFLGAATSLPELTAVITLFKLKSYDIALGNILGSNVFNMTIISVVDFINLRQHIFDVFETDQGLAENIGFLLILGLVNSIIVMVALLRKRSRNVWTYMIPSVLIVISYSVYIVLSL